MFIGLWNFVDDEGRDTFSTKRTKAQIFPADEISLDTIHRMFDELSTNGLISYYEVDNKQYFYVTGWRHQKIDRPQKARCPAPPENHSSNIRRSFAPEGKGREGIGCLVPTFSSKTTEHSPKLAANAAVSDNQPPELKFKQDEPPKPETSNQSRSKRKPYPVDFEEFWTAYPTDSNMSKQEAFKAWERVDNAERPVATKSLTAFRAYCSSHPDYRPVHANRYLTQRRFEGHAKTAERSSVVAVVAVKQESPGGRAWESFYRKTKGKGVPWMNGVWRMPSEFPPAIHPENQQTEPPP